MAYDTYIKDPAAVKDYLLNWRGGTKPFLAADEIIVASTFQAYSYPSGSPADAEWEVTTDITIDSDSFTDTTTVVWLSTGAYGAKYLVTNHITTDQDRQDDWTILIKMKQQ